LASFVELLFVDPICMFETIHFSDKMNSELKLQKKKKTKTIINQAFTSRIIIAIENILTYLDKLRDYKQIYY
jgi:hypothetical protein